MYKTNISFIDGEHFRDIVGYEGVYKVSNFGRVIFSAPFRGIPRLVSDKSSSKYKSLYLYKNNKKKRFSTHVLVAKENNRRYIGIEKEKVYFDACLNLLQDL